MSEFRLSRRRLLGLGAASASSLVLAGCDQFDGLLRMGHPVRSTLEQANNLTYQVQRLLGRDALAREYPESEIRQGMRPNGSTDPSTAEYLALRAGVGDTGFVTSSPVTTVFPQGAGIIRALLQHQHFE